MKHLSLIAVGALFPAFHVLAGAPRFDQGRDFAEACYTIPLPNLTSSVDNRTIPWGSPSINNGTSTCCASLDEVRAGIDSVDTQLLALLAQRAAFVREATRFKATHDTVDVPARNLQVIARAVDNAVDVHLPQSIAEGVFTAIINANVPFELCVFDSYHEHGGY